MQEEITQRMTVAAAALALSTTPTGILMLLRRGELTGQEASGSWQIDAGSVERLRTAATGDGPLISCQSLCASSSGCTGCGPGPLKKVANGG